MRSNCQKYVSFRRKEKSHNLIFCVVFLLMVFCSCGSSLKCCNTTNDVKELLIGSWKEVDSERKNLDNYSFSQGMGYFEELELMGDEEYLVIDDHTTFEIINNNQNFKIKFNNLLETWFSDIKYLNREKLVLATKGKEKEYYRFNE